MNQLINSKKIIKNYLSNQSIYEYILMLEFSINNISIFFQKILMLTKWHNSTN